MKERGRAAESSAPSAERSNRVRCVVCGWRDIAAGSDPLLADCPVCGATNRTMHLAALLLAFASRGMETTLRGFAGGRDLAGRRVLDLTGDSVLRMACRFATGYRAQGLLQSTRDAAEEVGAEIAAGVARLEPASADIVLLRDVLRLVPDLDAFLADTRSLLRPVGAIVFQDRFVLPLPPQARPVAEDERQQVVRDGPESGPAIAKLQVPVRRHLGADFLDRLAAHDLAATVAWPPAPSLLARRHAAVVAKRIPAPIARD